MSEADTIIDEKLIENTKLSFSTQLKRERGQT